MKASRGKTMQLTHREKTHWSARNTAVRSTCYLPKDAYVLTLEGQQLVQDLRPDSRLITRDKGAQPLLSIEKASGPRGAVAVKGTASSDARIFLDADSLILKRDARVISLFGHKEVFLRAGDIGDALQETDKVEFFLLSFGSPQVLYLDEIEIGTTQSDGDPNGRTILPAHQSQLLS